jgi:septation ring formation regulator EzrA
MKNDIMSDEELVAFVTKHPEMRASFSALAATVKNANGNFKEADDAEDSLIEELHKLGGVALHAWAKERVEAVDQSMRQTPRIERNGKKNFPGIRVTGS